MPIINDSFGFEVIPTSPVSTEGTGLGSVRSKVDVIFTGIPSRYDALNIKFRDNTFYPFTIYEQFQYLRYATGGQVNPTIYHSCAEGSTKEQQAYNYYQALTGDGHSYDEGDLAKEGIANLFTVSYVTGSDKVTITAVNQCVKFEQLMIPQSGVTLNIFNEDCTASIPTLTGTETITIASNPCVNVKLSIATNRTLVKITQPVQIDPNTANPFEVDVTRGSTISFSGLDEYGILLGRTYYTPPVLDVNTFSLLITNGSNSASVVVSNNLTQSSQFPLIFFYKLDNGLWTKGTTFDIPLGTSHIMYVKDQYGCEVSLPFQVSGYQDQSSDTIEKTFCGDLHELNVGKYLNLFGKQHTMKLGFVCNAEPNTVKIFKHIQMILSIDYAIKNVSVTTSLKQERFIPGSHMTYRIREGMHSVPLKNPRDWDDLRGTWAYIELEIESINNSKVDLFSVIMHLRKSTI